jgi:hypothetical protein
MTDSIDESISLARSLKDSSCRNIALTRIIVGFARAARYQEANDLARVLENG